MALSLKESNAIAAMAELLYDFLPGSGSRAWKGHVTFQTLATKLGLGDYWPVGSKTPAIAALLGHTLQHDRSLFEPLILEIVRNGILYRQKQKCPITAPEIDRLNGHILELGFKFPDLWDRSFRESLCKDGATRAKEHVDRVIAEQRLQASAKSQRSIELARLQEEFCVLQTQPDRQAAGLAVEKTLNKLFSLEGLSPREPFRVVGEQIDGSFELDYETYLLEAKWEKHPLPEAPLLVLRGKIEGKSPYTRGVFIALNGISKEAKEAITRGKELRFFVINGHDILMVLSEQVALVDFLRQRQRLLAEEGLVVVPYSELWTESRRR